MAQIDEKKENPLLSIEHFIPTPINEGNVINEGAQGIFRDSRAYALEDVLQATCNEKMQLMSPFKTNPEEALDDMIQMTITDAYNSIIGACDRYVIYNLVEDIFSFFCTIANETDNTFVYDTINDTLSEYVKNEEHRKQQFNDGIITDEPDDILACPITYRILLSVIENHLPENQKNYGIYIISMLAAEKENQLSTPEVTNVDIEIVDFLVNYMQATENRKTYIKKLTEFIGIQDDYVTQLSELEENQLQHSPNKSHRRTVSLTSGTEPDDIQELYKVTMQHKRTRSSIQELEDIFSTLKNTNPYMLLQ